MPGNMLPNFQPSRFSVGVGAPSFVPTDNDSLLSWWEPSDASMSELSDGSGSVENNDQVGRLLDRSLSGGFTASTATAGFRPTYEELPGSKKGLRFDLGNSSQLDVPTLALSNGGNFTVVIAAGVKNTSDRLYALRTGTGAGLFLLAFSNNNSRMGFYDGAWKDFEATASPSGAYVWTWVFDGTGGTATGYRDGVEVGTVAYTPQNLASPSTLMARDDTGDYLYGSLNSFTIFDEALSDADREEVEAYAASKLYSDPRYGSGITHTFSGVTTIGSDVHASQSVNGDETDYFWTTAENTNREITTWENNSGSFGASLFVKNGVTQATATISQVNGMWHDAGNDKLYVSGNNFPTTPKVGIVMEFDIETDGSLTKVAEFSVGANWSEGVVFNGTDFLVIYHDIHAIRRYNSSWVLQETHNLPGPDPSFNETNYHQDIDIYGSLYAVNIHGNNDLSPLMLFYNSDFTFAGAANPPANCTQGFKFEDATTVIFAQRPSSSATPPNNVIRATIAAV